MTSTRPEHALNRPLPEARQLAERLKLAQSAGREAGQGTLDFFCQEGLQVELKSDFSPVTAADRAAESLLRERIRERFPRDAVLGEEFGELPGDSGFRWVLDPIDGTKTFVRGVPMYGTMIGVEFEGEPVIGLVYVPPLDEMVFAARGGGAWHVVSGKTRPARVSPVDRMSDGLFVTTAVNSFGARRATYEILENQFRITRTWGDCYGYLLVATGRAECMVDPVMNVWDAAAILPILEEAGGTFTDWQGVPTINSGEGVATNGLLRDAVIAITRAAQ